MLGKDNKFSLQVVPFIEVLVVLEPLDTAANFPPAPNPVNSKAVIAPAVLTAVTVIVMLLVVDAPPRLVPANVSVSNLV